MFNTGQRWIKGEDKSHFMDLSHKNTNFEALFDVLVLGHKNTNFEALFDYDCSEN